MAGRSAISRSRWVGISWSREQGKNMRKLVWAGTAVVLLGAVAVYFAADYAAHHPDSWFARCTAVAGYLGGKCNPLAAISTSVAQHGPAEQGVAVCDPVQIPKP